MHYALRQFQTSVFGTLAACIRGAQIPGGSNGKASYNNDALHLHQQ